MTVVETFVPVYENEVAVVRGIDGLDTLLIGERYRLFRLSCRLGLRATFPSRNRKPLDRFLAAFLCSGISMDANFMEEQERLLSEWDNRSSTFFEPDTGKRLHNEIQLLEALRNSGCEKTRDGITIMEQLDERHVVLREMMKKKA